ncbi:MAG: response regulator transcription factor [Verrucomicrobiales bacterium]|nr:response regulator transcription factor [Verrucomicrobiales bacterium]
MIRVSIVEDDSHCRELLAATLRAAADLNVVSVHHDGAHALAHLPEARPHVALVDVRLPRLSGPELVGRLRRRCPKTLFVMLTAFDDEELLYASLRAGAVGYLLKHDEDRDLADAVREVRSGGSPMSPEIARRLIATFRGEDPAAATELPLTPREIEILRHASRGKTSKEIARDLEIAEVTVNNHFRHIYEKLHVNSRAAAVARFLDPNQGLTKAG